MTPVRRETGPALIRLARFAAAGALFALAVGAARPAHAAWFEICRGLNLGSNLDVLEIPQGTLFRDDGRADDPLADFSGDKWQLRVETLYRIEIDRLSNCVRVLVRITSDSSTKSVAASDNRRFVYAGSANLLDDRLPSETLLTTRGRVIDSIP